MIKTRENKKLQNIAKEWLRTEHPEGNVQSLVNLILNFAEQETKELEKEVTELKKVKQVKIEVTRDYKKLAKDLQEQGNQLTKAKDVIKKILHALKNEDSDYTFALENTRFVLTEVEQFLKESE